jgi:predicted nucleic acid-binding protein
MKLFAVYNNDWYYDEIDEVLIAADSEAEAIEIAVNDVRDFNVFSDLEVKEVPFTKGILFESFHAG